MSGQDDFGSTTIDSADCELIELSDRGVDMAEQMARPRPANEAYLLNWMRQRVVHFGTPLPEGYIPPPGIDLAALLKQVPGRPRKRTESKCMTARRVPWSGLLTRPLRRTQGLLFEPATISRLIR